MSGGMDDQQAQPMQGSNGARPASSNSARRFTTTLSTASTSADGTPGSSAGARRFTTTMSSASSIAVGSSPLAGQLPGRSASPMMARRARQLQADEGITPQPPAAYRPPAMREGASLQEQLGSNVKMGAGDIPASSSVSSSTGPTSTIRLDTRDDPLMPNLRLLSQGRARAGTLPSSWGNTGGQSPSLASSTGSRYTGSSQLQPHPQQQQFDSQNTRLLGFSPIGGDYGAGRPRSSQMEGRWGEEHTRSGPATPIDLNATDFFLGSTNGAMAGSFVSRGATSSTGNHSPLLRQFGNASPDLGHSGSFASGTAPSGDYRARSSSGTANMTGLGSNVFGPSIFTSAWGDQRSVVGGGGGGSAGTGSTTSRRSSTFAPLSVTSIGQDSKGSYKSSFDYGASNAPGSYEDGQMGDVHDVQTLDYLGLHDDVSVNTSSTANADRSAHSRFVAGLAPQQRNRASTLAAMPPGQADRMRSIVSAASTPHNVDSSSYRYPTAEAATAASSAAAASSRLHDLYNAYAQQGTASLQGRNRAGTIAAVGGPEGRQHFERELVRMATTGGLSNVSAADVTALLASLRGLDMGGSGDEYQSEGLDTNRSYLYAPLEGFPHLDILTPPSRSGRPSPYHTTPSTPIALQPAHPSRTPEDGSTLAAAARVSTLPPSQHTMARQTSSAALAGSATHQTPSRSLWIGNLASTTTGQELMHAFAPYGAIESLRLLPEKECGFVNFVEMADAIRARDDVLNRLGARLDALGTGQGGTVRIGFGKIDTVPVTSGAAASGNSAATRPSALVADMNAYSMPDEAAAGLAVPGGTAMALSTSDASTPTRALWVGSIPSSVTPATLMSIFQPFGPVESARVLTHKNCGFVNFERVEDAVRARKMLHGRDVLGSEVGAMRIGFAKVPTRNAEQAYTTAAAGSEELDAVNAAMAQQGGQRADEPAGGMENYRSHLVTTLLSGQPSLQPPTQRTSPPPPVQQPTHADEGRAHVAAASRATGTSSSSSIVPASDKGGVPLPAHMAPRAGPSDLQLLMRELSQGDADIEADVASVAEARPMATYYMTVPLVSEVSSGRRFETMRLRETRRGIESGQYTKPQCDQLAAEYVDYIVDLASDYIGNTLVQKFFEVCSDARKMDMLQRLAPHLAVVGCHKNGTWAAQKILDCADSVEQVRLIGQNLRPYVPGLLLDSFGNYVVQCCLRWTGYNDFVFDAMVDRCWEVAQGRFGARSMRACLENANVTKQQRKRVAIAIVLNAVPLATSPNGAILLTWLLETSGLQRSYRLLAPRFTPHLSHLCTHKLASGTVLRIVTQKSEPEASQAVLDALFDGDEQERVLEDVIVDQVHGSQFITKVLASPTLLHVQRDRYAEQVRALLQKHNLVGVPAYRRLCEDLGLAVPHPSGTKAEEAMAYGAPASQYNTNGTQLAAPVDKPPAPPPPNAAAARSHDLFNNTLWSASTGPFPAGPPPPQQQRPTNTRSNSSRHH